MSRVELTDCSTALAMTGSIGQIDKSITAVVLLILLA